jgi:hypothetical protein
MPSQVNQREAQMRGEGKTKAQSLVDTHYKLEGEAPEIANRVAALLTKGCFHFADITDLQKVSSMLPRCPVPTISFYPQPLRPFENTIIAKLLYRQVFASRKADGRHPAIAKLLNPVPLTTIALLCTMVSTVLSHLHLLTYSLRLSVPYGTGLRGTIIPRRTRSPSMNMSQSIRHISKLSKTFNDATQRKWTRFNGTCLQMPRMSFLSLHSYFTHTNAYDD